jgi:ubiquinone/menaquinone biosynthesis C-methylase UbiE
VPFDHFNLIAKYYDRGIDFIPSEELIQLLGLPTKGSLLDAGGGTGRVAAALRTQAGRIVVSDPSRGMLRYAREKELVAICAPGEHLPFPSGSFDRILMVDAFHHVLDQGRTIDELWRVLQPGGRILIIEPDIHQFIVRLIALGEKILLMRSHFLSHEKITSLFNGKNARVKVVKSMNNVMVLVEKAR